MDYLTKIVAAAVKACIPHCNGTTPTNDHCIVQDSWLLDLPRELRDHILSYLLVEPAYVTLKYVPIMRCRYARRMKARVTYGKVRTWGGPKVPSHVEFYDFTDTYIHLMMLSQSCRQISDEAQEMFFCRNRFIFGPAPQITSLPKMHCRWISKVRAWCRPSLGAAGLIWVRVVVEKTQERPVWKVSWTRYKYENDEDLDEELCQKLIAWTRDCENLMLRKLQGYEDFMDLNAIMSVLQGPPVCKSMEIALHPESKLRR